MTLIQLKRKIKGKLQNKKKSKKEKNFNLPMTSLGMLILGIIMFCVVQLAVVSVLGPQGKQLKQLNSEKEALLEQNHYLNQQIAKYSSLPVIQGRAQNELDMKRAENIVYLSIDQDSVAYSSDQNPNTLAQTE